MSIIAIRSSMPLGEAYVLEANDGGHGSGSQRRHFLSLELIVSWLLAVTLSTPHAQPCASTTASREFVVVRWLHYSV